jgi:hypothetical protein
MHKLKQFKPVKLLPDSQGEQGATWECEDGWRTRKAAMLVLLMVGIPAVHMPLRWPQEA